MGSKNKNSAYKTTFIFLGGVSLGLLIAFLINNPFKKDMSEQDIPIADSSPINQLKVRDSNTIYVSGVNQEGQLVVGSVSLMDPGFVVVHEANEDDQPGDIIGASEYINAGDSTNISIDLDRPTADEEILFAMIHKDDGNQQFDDTETDPPVIEDEGPVFMRVTISEEFTEATSSSNFSL